MPGTMLGVTMVQHTADLSMYAQGVVERATRKGPAGRESS